MYRILIVIISIILNIFSSLVFLILLMTSLGISSSNISLHLAGVSLAKSKHFSDMHLIKEFKFIEIELSSVFTDFVDVELVNHVLQG